MRLKVLLPTRLLCETEVSQVTAESANGFFSLLPRHIDFVTALVPGLLFYRLPDGEQEFLAVDEGILVKCGPEVRISTYNAIRGPDLGTLQAQVRQQFRQVNERERRARDALFRLQAELVRRYIQLEERGHD